jgi:phage-related baseplate assembly protein
MARFTTEGLPYPVVIQPLDYEATLDRRLAEFVETMHEHGVEYDVEDMETDPAVIGAEAAAVGDSYFIDYGNHVARVVLLPSFAIGSDLDLHVARNGLTRFSGETDAALRERDRLARKGKSAAGPDDYYKSKARDTDVRVRDVAVEAETRNASERVLILSVLTSDNGGLIGDELKDTLTAALNDPSFRSRNVTVEVVPAIITTKNVVATIYIYPETPDVVVTQARQALLDAVTADQQLGFDLTESYVTKHLHRSGVQRVELQSWVDAFADFNEAIRLGTVTVTTIRLTS